MWTYYRFAIRIPIHIGWNKIAVSICENLVWTAWWQSLTHWVPTVILLDPVRNEVGFFWSIFECISQSLLVAASWWSLSYYLSLMASKLLYLGSMSCYSLTTLFTYGPFDSISAESGDDYSDSYMDMYGECWLAWLAKVLQPQVSNRMTGSLRAVNFAS